MFWFIWSTLWSLNPVLLFPEVMCCWTFLSIPAAKFFGFICLGQESTFFIFKTYPHTCVTLLKFNRKKWKLSLVLKIYRGIIFKDLSFEKLFIFQINRISAYFVSYVQRILHGRKHQGLKHIEKSQKNYFFFIASLSGAGSSHPVVKHCWSHPMGECPWRQNQRRHHLSIKIRTLLDEKIILKNWPYGGVGMLWQVNHVLCLLLFLFVDKLTNFQRCRHQ